MDQRTKPSVSARLMALFPASQKSHAYFTPGHESLDHKGKTVVHWLRGDGTLEEGYCNVKIPITEKHWQQHIKGTRALVVGLWCDEGTTASTTVDVDINNMDDETVLQLLREISELQAPLYVHRSKSRGIHVQAFHPGIPGAHSNKIALGIAHHFGLIQYAEDCGCRPPEYFPKPVTTPDKHPFGLNMPYLGGKQGYLDVHGNEIPLEQFLDTVKFFQPEHFKFFLESAEKAKKSGKRGRPKKASEPDETPLEQGQRFAKQILEQFAEELETLPSGQHNIELRDRAFKLGTMIHNEWCDRQHVEDVLTNAIRGWGSYAEEVKNLKRHLNAGEKIAHRPLLAKSKPLTEDRMALEFAEDNAERLRYDCETQKWHEWIETHWKRIVGNKVRDEIRDAVRIATVASKPQAQKTTRRVTFCANVEKFVRESQKYRIEVSTDIWDRNPLLLGTPGGTIDLMTGELRPSSREDYISRITTVTPAKTEECDEWLKTIWQITCGDNEQGKFLQRAGGYTLLGHNREQKLFFGLGPGGNGKGILTETMGRAMGGDLKFIAPPGMFATSPTQMIKPTNSLASARGSRILISDENAADYYWDENLIKHITGSSEQTARLLHQNLTTFDTTFTPWLEGNREPRLRTVNEAIRRRVILLLFQMQTTTNKENVDEKNWLFLRDPDLPEKLKAELPGILRWLLNGTMMYHEHKFLDHTIPKAIRDANVEFFSTSDFIGRFLEHEYVKTENKADQVDAATIHSRYAEACLTAKETPLIQGQFTKELKTRGYETTTIHGYAVFIKLKYRPADKNSVI
jgi:putative DNA primase/helicase